MTLATASPESPALGAPPTERVGEPYVGLRPYGERERELFQGRDEDAVRLRNKIFAGEITVLYAPSGVGKTSLLRTLVVPDLRAQEALVVYFDDWHDDPLPGLKGALLARAEAEGCAVSVEPDAPLARVAEAVVDAAKKPLVLVLDQFEAFLIRHARHLDPLRDELAALARSKVDSHIVLSLREEFVASLDAFRERIATLFRSTYRLLPLMGEGAHKAITRPAELFGGSYDPALVEALLEDLRVSSRFEGDPAAVHGGSVDLPFLQIVCLRLWRRALATGTRQLTLESYKQLGRCDGIIRHYVDQVVSAIPRGQRCDMAKVLDYLAPRSGTKMSYAVQDLAERTGLPEDRIAALLQHLHDNWVVRSRQSGDAKTSELYHDTFIKILRPWVDQELGRSRRRRLALLSVSGGLAVALVVLVTSGWKDQKAERDRTSGVFQRLASVLGTARTFQDSAHYQDDVTTGVDGVARYLVGKGDLGSLERLDTLLRRHEKMITRLYARPTAAEAVGSVGSLSDAAGPSGALPSGPEDSPGDSEAARSLPPREQRRQPTTLLATETRDLANQMHKSGVPLAMLYNPSESASDSAGLWSAWSPLAEQLLDSLGLPAPRALVPFPDSAVPTDSRWLLSAQSAGPVVDTLPVLWSDNSVVLQQDSLPANVQKYFFARPPVGWGRLPMMLPGGPWWILPRWTLPIWRASGQPPRSRVDLLALAIAVRLIEKPELLFTPEATRYLLRRAAGETEIGVEDALAVRGYDGVRQVFIAVVRTGRPLLPLPTILDVMADYPEETPNQIAARLSRDPSLQLGENRQLASTPSAARPSGATALDTSSPIIRAYPSLYSGASVKPIRVYLGDTLVHRLAFEGRGELRPEILSAISDLRVELLRRFGLAVPFISFRADTTLQPSGFRVELLTQTHRDSGVAIQSARGDSALYEVVAALSPPLVASRLHWLTSDGVDELVTALPSGQRTWIRAHFINRELKLLLRAVLAPPAEQPAAPSAESPADRSIAHTQWLLGSLVFWDRTGELSDRAKTAVRLRRTQRARLDTTNGTAPSGPVAQLVARGIAALEADQVAQASKAFGTAVTTDRTAAEAAFLVLYPQRATPLQITRLANECQLPEPGKVAGDSLPLGDPTRAELEDLLGRPLRGDDAAQRQPLQECLMRGYVAAKRFDRAGALFDRMMADQPGASWRADDGYRVAYWALMAPDMASTTARWESAHKLMLNAMAHRVAPASDETRVAGELAGMCSSSSAVRGCYAMLDTIIARDSLGFHLPFDVGRHLAWRSYGRVEARHALQLLDRALGRIAAVGSDAPWYAAQARWARAKANLTLAGHGEPGSADAAVAELRALLRELPALVNGPKSAEVYSTLTDAYIALGEIDKADAALHEDPLVAGDTTLRSTSYFLLLARGQLDSARAIADAMLAESETDAPSLFLASVSRLLAGDTSAVAPAVRFLDETDHEYRDYIRMMLYWSLRSRGQGDSATALINDRWKGIDRSTWSRRIAQGDVSAWREMLIGYYAGHVGREEIVGPLTDEASYRDSPLSALGFPLNAARCEAYFYDSLLQGVRGFSWTRHKRQLASLDQAIATRYYPYYEYHMARILRDRLRGGDGGDGGDRKVPSQPSPVANR